MVVNDYSFQHYAGHKQQLVLQWFSATASLFDGLMLSMIDLWVSISYLVNLLHFVIFLIFKNAEELEKSYGYKRKIAFDTHLF